TAEGSPFSHDEFEILLSLANKGINELIAFQAGVLGDLAKRIGGMSSAKNRSGLKE
ncbi:MAG TPA: ribonuclease PH, partial [Firmicutes bacterium]|nr:ribonuclease PH [Bacillota bacterium]